MAIRTIEVPFRDDYNIGVGADLASGSPIGFVVDGTAEGVQICSATRLPPGMGTTAGDAGGPDSLAS